MGELVFYIAAIFCIGLISFTLVRKSEAERREVEQIRWRERDKGQEYLDIAGVILLALNAEQKVTLINRKGCKILGYKEEEIIGKNWFDQFVPEWDRERVRAAFVRLMPGGHKAAEYFENPVLTKRGEERIIAWHDTLLTDETGNITGTLSSGEDITERKKAEEELIRLSAAVKMSNDGIVIFDLEGKIVDINEAALKMYQTEDRNDFIGENYLNFIALEEQDRALAGMDEVIQKGSTKNREFNIITRKGDIISVEINTALMKNANGKPIGLVSTIRDISGHKQTEEALRESEEKYRALIEAAGRAGEGIIIIQDNKEEEAVFVSVNDQFCKISDYSEEELLGKSPWDLIPQEISARLKDWYKRRHTGESLPGHYEAAGIRKDGAAVPLDLSVVTMPWEGKIATVLYLRDITERKKAEEEIRTERDKLESVTKNIGVGLAIISKDYRTVWANEVLKQIFGEVEGKLCYNTYNCRPDICPGCGVREVFKQGKDVSVHEQVGKDKHGNTIWSQIIATPLKDKEGNITASMEVVVPITERKKAEERLKAEKEFSEKLISTTNAIIVGLDKEHRILLFNQGAERITGYKAKEIIGQDWFKIFFKEEMYPEMIRVWKDAWGKDTYSYTNPIYSKTGKEITAQWSNTSIKDSAGGIVMLLCIAVDLTERKKAEELLRTSQAQLSNAMKIAKLGYWEYDVAKDLFTFDDHFYAIFRTTAEKVGGYKMSSARYAELFVHPDDRSLVGIEIQKALETNDPHFSRQLEHRIIYADGEIGYITVRFFIVKDDKGNTVRTFGANQDITERKKAEEAVRESEQRYRGVVDNIGIGVSLISPNMEILFLNEQMKKWFPNVDISKEAICYKALNNPPKEEACSYCPTNKTLKDGQIHESITDTPAGNKIINYRVLSSPIKDLQGKVIAAIEMVEDITEKKRLQQQLIQTEKLAAVGTLAYGIAHEFNNILAGMMANAELGLISKEHEQIKECFEIIVDNSKRASSITNNLLAFARHKEARKELVDITESLKSVLAITHRELEKNNIEIVEKFKPAPKIYCDPGQFSEVFLNMITNARDAMHPKGGTLTIQVEPAGENIQVIFKDTGCGIPDEIKDKIFEPFVTTKGALGRSEVPGTGLGLFLTYGIISGHKGKIEVETKVGKGTKFSIIIPISENQPRELLLDTRIKSSKETEKKLKILLVDDEKAITFGLKKFLESKGHKVSTSLRGKEGLEIFRKGRFDLVLSDITIPDMDGIELIKKVKEKDPQAKIIVITGHLQKEKEEKARQAGADEVLIKPFKNELLYQTISKIVI